MPRAKRTEVPKASHPKGVKARVLYALAMHYHHRSWTDVTELLTDLKTTQDGEVRTERISEKVLKDQLKELTRKKFVERHGTRKSEYRATNRGRNIAPQLSSF